MYGSREGGGGRGSGPPPPPEKSKNIGFPNITGQGPLKKKAQIYQASVHC